VTTEDKVPDFRLVAASAQRLGQPFPKPFFLAHGIYYPHNPWTVPQRFLDLYPEDQLVFPPPAWKEGDLDDLSETAKKIAAAPWDFSATRQAGYWKPVVRHYLACVSAADELVGKLLDALDQSPYATNTIVVLWGDNGFHLGEKDHFAKFTLWQQTANIPLIIRVPGLTTAGAVCERAVSLQDLYPTLAELCGLNPPGHELDGRSLVPLLKDPAREWPFPALTSGASPGDFSVRTERHAYLRYADGSEELYDYARDPHEWTNQAGNPEYTAVKAELAKTLPREVVSKNSQQPARKGSEPGE
jgi:arylsulfatase A-like enzyme